MHGLKIVIIIINIFHLTLLYSQDHDTITEHNGRWPHTFGIMVGYAWVPTAVNESGEPQINVIPTLGLDYAYFFNHHFGLGFVNDIEFERYLVDDNEGGIIERENKIISAITAIYELNQSISIFGGPGIEFDKNEIFPLVKVGFEIVKRLDDGWGFGFNASIDVNEVYQTISAGVIIFKHFPSGNSRH